uniref:Putative wound-responsive family protein n=1 Tax=Helianthus annuus TaxID=4232 RepID=A0A251RN04_HELAN
MSSTSRAWLVAGTVGLVEALKDQGRAWMVAGTVGLVEALKDQGFARWNYTIRAIHHHAKSNLRSVTQTKKLSSPAAMASSKGIDQSEESLRKVMYLSCWGPN